MHCAHRLPAWMTGLLLLLAAPALFALQYVGDSVTGNDEQRKAEIARVALDDPLLNPQSGEAVEQSVRVMAASFGNAERARQAAEQGEPKALYLQALREAFGLEGEADAAGAVDRLQRVAQGPQDAEPEGTPGTYRVLAEWALYEIASGTLAEDEALSALDGHYEPDESVLIDHLVSAARWGVPQAQYVLAETILEGGYGLEPMLPAALVLLARSAEAGFSPAQARHEEVAEAYLDQSRLEAIKQRIVEGDLDALEALAELYEAGDHVAPNPAMAQALRTMHETMEP